MHRPGIGRLFLYGGIAAVVAAIGVWATLYTWSSAEPELPEPQPYDIPSEVPCLIAASATEELPNRITARKPHLRLRESAPHQFELLYWGNPVRESYSFSITKVSDKKSVLIHPNGNAEPYRELQVSVPNEIKGTIILQPSTPLRNLSGKPGEYYAAKISVHDATDGTILCTAVYLLCGDTAQ